MTTNYDLWNQKSGELLKSLQDPKENGNAAELVMLTDEAKLMALNNILKEADFEFKEKFYGEACKNLDGLLARRRQAQM